MGKRGSCPSLIGCTHGTPKIEQAKGKRGCKRCGIEIQKGTYGVVVPIPGQMGRKVYCLSCSLEIIAESRKDLEGFEQRVRNHLT